MKKIYFLVFIAVFMLIPFSVNAEEGCKNSNDACITCAYGDSGDIIIKVEENKNPIMYNNSVDSKYTYEYVMHDVSYGNFKNNTTNKLQCPTSIWFYTQRPDKNNVMRPDIYLTKKKGTAEFKLNNEKSDTSKSDLSSKKDSKICEYTTPNSEINFYIEDGKLKTWTLTNGFGIAGQSVDIHKIDFSGECPSLRIDCSTAYSSRTCVIYTSKPNINPDQIQDAEDIEQNNQTGTNNNNDNNNGGTNKDFAMANCEAMIDLFQKYFDWIKFGACILLVFFGTLDFAKAVLSSDQDMLKKATSNFVKRCIAALAVFFIPMLIGLIFEMPGISDKIEVIVCNLK